MTRPWQPSELARCVAQTLSRAEAVEPTPFDFGASQIVNLGPYRLTRGDGGFAITNGPEHQWQRLHRFDRLPDHMLLHRTWRDAVARTITKKLSHGS